MLSLGEHLVNQLKQDDLVSQWMAHYIAERMTTLESLQGSSQTGAKAEIADLIFKLWQHGRGAGFDDPVASSEKVRRAVARLDPTPETPYFGSLGGNWGPLGEETELEQLLRVIEAFDRDAGRLVSLLVRQAVAAAEDADAPWVERARAAQADPMMEIRELFDRIETAPADGSSASSDMDRDRIATQAAKVIALLEPLTKKAPTRPQVREP